MQDQPCPKGRSQDIDDSRCFGSRAADVSGGNGSFGSTRQLRSRPANGRNRRAAAARRQAEAFLERPIFGIKRLFLNACGIRGPGGGKAGLGVLTDQTALEFR
jgi:hypothetical protein